MLDTFNKDEILQSLNERLCTVTFIKKNGDKRVMSCTLNSTLFKTEKVSSDETKVIKKNPDVQAVYDVEAEGWRSFRWDSLVEFVDTKTL